MRRALAPRHADANSRRTNGEAARRQHHDPDSRNRVARPPTRSTQHWRPRRTRTRREVLVPRGFVPLRTH